MHDCPSPAQAFEAPEKPPVLAIVDTDKTDIAVAAIYAGFYESLKASGCEERDSAIRCVILPERTSPTRAASSVLTSAPVSRARRSA